MYRKQCPECGREFETDLISKVYCSRTCAKRAKKEKWRREHPIKVKVCEICGKEFEPANNNSKYCCYDCKIKGREKWRAENKDRIRQLSHKRAGKYYDGTYKSVEMKEPQKMPPPKKSLAEMAREAREHGMTYGQYEKYCIEQGKEWK